MAKKIFVDREYLEEQIKDKAGKTYVDEQDKKLDDKFGVLSEDRGYLNSKLIPITQDIDTVIENGVYTWEYGDNPKKPAGGGSYFVKVQKIVETYVLQEVTMGWGEGKTYTRVMDNGTWGQWDSDSDEITVLAGGNVKNASDIGVTDANNLPIGWFSGHLTHAPKDDWFAYHTFNTLDAGYKTQVAYGINNNQMYKRIFIAGSYTDWRSYPGELLEEIPTGTDIIEYVKQLPPATQKTIQAPNAKNTPFGDIDTWWYFDILKHTNNSTYAVIKAYPFFQDKFFIGRIDNNVFKGWKELATTDKIDISLPLNDGYKIEFPSDENSIRKNSLDMVTLAFTVSKNDGGVINSSFINIPVGFRPKKNITTCGRVYLSTDGIKTAPFVVFSDGRVELRETDTVKKIVGSITYYTD